MSRLSVRFSISRTAFGHFSGRPVVTTRVVLDASFYEFARLHRRCVAQTQPARRRRPITDLRLGRFSCFAIAIESFNKFITLLLLYFFFSDFLFLLLSDKHVYGRVCVYNNNNHRRKHIFLCPPRETTVGQGAGTVRASCRQTRDAAYVIEISRPFTEGVRDVSGLRVEGFCPGGCRNKGLFPDRFPPLESRFKHIRPHLYVCIYGQSLPRTIISAGVQKTCRKSTISHPHPTARDRRLPPDVSSINGGRYTRVSFCLTREIHQNGWTNLHRQRRKKTVACRHPGVITVLRFLTFLRPIVAANSLRF